MRPGPPLAHRDHHQQQSEHQLEPVHPGRRLALLAGVRRAGDRQQDRAGQGDPGDPAQQERRAVGAGSGGDQHQDHGHDRHGADGDPDRERQQLPDRRTHPSTLVVGA
jgi:hypothetical protein